MFLPEAPLVSRRHLRCLSPNCPELTRRSSCRRPLRRRQPWSLDLPLYVCGLHGLPQAQHSLILLTSPRRSFLSQATLNGCAFSLPALIARHFLLTSAHLSVSQHLEAGLAVVFIEAPDQMQEELTIPQVMLDQCAALNIPSTGNSVGLMSTTDFPGAVRGPYPQILGWRPKGIGALAGTILAALLGMATVCWYALGEQIEADEMHDEVMRELEKKKRGGLIKRGVKKAFGKK